MYPGVLDTTAFPHLAAYLNALPSGLDTYPEAKTRNTFNAILQKQMQDVFTSRRLPEVLHHPLHDPGTPNQWVSTTVHAALCALA